MPPTQYRSVSSTGLASASRRSGVRLQCIRLSRLKDAAGLVIQIIRNRAQSQNGGPRAAILIKVRQLLLTSLLRNLEVAA